MVSDPTPAPPLQGRGVPMVSSAAVKTHLQCLSSGRGVPAVSSAAVKTHSQRLPSGRGVPAESSAAVKTHLQCLPSGRGVPTESPAPRMAVAAPLPCRGGVRGGVTNIRSGVTNIRSVATTPWSVVTTPPTVACNPLSVVTLFIIPSTLYRMLNDEPCAASKVCSDVATEVAVGELDLLGSLKRPLQCLGLVLAVG